MRLTFLLSKVKAVPISLFRGTKGGANHVFQRGNDYQDSDVRQNSCICRKSWHFERPGEGIFINITQLKTDFCFFYSAHTKKTVTTQREEQKKYMLILKKKV